MVFLFEELRLYVLSDATQRPIKIVNICNNIKATYFLVERTSYISAHDLIRDYWAHPL